MLAKQVLQLISVFLTGFLLTEEYICFIFQIVAIMNCDYCHFHLFLHFSVPVSVGLISYT